MRKLVVLAPNWLGDAVMALPLVADLRRGWPDTALVMAARPGVAPLYTMVPGLAGTLTLGGADDVAQLAGLEADAALLLPNSFASAWLVRRAGIKDRWGYARDLRGPLLTRAIRRPRHYAHQADYYQGLARALGLDVGAAVTGLSVPDAAYATARTLLAEAGLTSGQPFVVAAPGAAYGRAKQWPPARFAELARRLADDGVATVLVGTKADRPACEDVRQASSAISLASRTDLPTLAAVLASSRAVVANDSGAMHLAAAVGVPVVAIFGPTNDRKTAPLRAAFDAPSPAIVATDVWCRPCMLRECPIDHRCMTRVSAGRVYETLQVALS